MAKNLRGNPSIARYRAIGFERQSRLARSGLLSDYFIVTRKALRIESIIGTAMPAF
jgi:hypothetical protein